MPDRVAVLREGVVQQVDTPENVYHRPVNRFVATVVGSPPMNFIPCTVGRTQRRAAAEARSVRGRAARRAGSRSARRWPRAATACSASAPRTSASHAAGDDAFGATVYVVRAARRRDRRRPPGRANAREGAGAALGPGHAGRGGRGRARPRAPARVHGARARPCSPRPASRSSPSARPRRSRDAAGRRARGAHRRPRERRPLSRADRGAAGARPNVPEDAGRQPDQRRGRRGAARTAERRDHEGGRRPVRAVRPRGTGGLRRRLDPRRHGSRPADADRLLRDLPAGPLSAALLQASQRRPTSTCGPTISTSTR